MALYSFNHASFGKTTNKAGAAAKNAAYNAREGETRLAGKDGPNAATNAAYNAREEATFAVRSHVIPAEPDKAEAWFRAQEKGDRANARMSDRFIAALPRELTPEQCIQAVESFCRGITKDRIPWHFALHLELDKTGEKDWNPHAHIIFRDRDIDTGKRYLHTTAGPKERAQLAEKGIQCWSTKDFRIAWNDELNLALERAGRPERVDHRSLKEQGIERPPQIHEGPAARRMPEKGRAFHSRDARKGERVIAYTVIDDGRSRLDHNAAIKQVALLSQQANVRHQVTGQYAPAGKAHAPEATPQPRSLEAREKKTLHDEQQHKWRALSADQKQDREALKRIQKAQTGEQRTRAKQHFADARKEARDEVGRLFAGRWEAINKIKDPRERAAASNALKREQSEAYRAHADEHMRQARADNDRQRQALRVMQDQARSNLRAEHRNERTALTRATTASRIGLNAHWHAHHATRQAKGFTGSQSMAGQQPQQMAYMRARAAQAKRDAAQPRPMHPNDFGRAQVAQWQHEASRRAYDLANQSRAEYASIRERLNLNREMTGNKAELTDRRTRQAVLEENQPLSSDATEKRAERARNSTQRGGGQDR